MLIIPYLFNNYQTRDVAVNYNYLHRLTTHRVEAPRQNPGQGFMSAQVIQLMPLSLTLFRPLLVLFHWWQPILLSKIEQELL